MQLELYFAEEDICMSMEFYSLRNELEALNSIVLLTDISLSRCSHLNKNILQGLRQTILDLITDLGVKNSVTGGVVQKDHSCDQEERLIEWGESNGVKTQLKIACKFQCDFLSFCTNITFPFNIYNTNFFPLKIYTDIEGAGRGAIARKDLNVGDIALEIPVSIIISEELIHETEMVCFLVEKR